MICPGCALEVAFHDSACPACAYVLPSEPPGTTLAGSISEGESARPTTRAIHVVASPGLPPGRQTFLPLGGPLQIGRGAEVALLDGKLSRVHCSVFPLGRGGEHAVKDLASRNGTFVNGERINEQELRVGDVIRVGDSLLVYGRCPPERDAGAEERASRLVGAGADLAELHGALRRVAKTDLTVLVEGETGTGKELVAGAVHEASGRRGPLLAINAAAVPESLFESEVFGHVKGAFTGAIGDSRGLFVNAAGGTLFLDEIGELSLTVQAKLLRVLEQRAVRPLGGEREVKVDVRVVAATNVRLRERVDAGTFRGDLYARLSEARLSLPPLRQRREDVLPLARAFLRDALGEEPAPELTPDFAEALLLHAWPFNVRELRSLVRRLAALHGEEASWAAGLLPDDIRGAASGKHAAAALAPVAAAGAGTDRSTPRESDLRALLERNDGNVKEVAKAVGKDRAQVYRWLHRYGLNPESFRRR